MKKVTMFVWNHFTNDARVNRECTALSETYDVNLIAIDDPKDKTVLQDERVNPHFRVKRVKRYPFIITSYQQDKKQFLVTVGGITTVVAVGLFFIHWTLLLIYFGLLLAGAFVVKVKKFRKYFVNGAIIFRMIKEGYLQHADIYHSNDLNTLPQGIACAKLRLKPRKLIYDSHEVQTSRTGYQPERIKTIEKFLLHFVDEMMVENHTRAAHNEELYGFYPKTLYNYSELYDIDDKPKIHLHEKLGLPKDEKILLYQGGLQAGRGLELLIEAMPKIDEGTLVFIGAGKLESRLKDMAASSVAADRIKFIPKVHFKELPSYTREAYLGFQVLQNICFNHYSASSNKLFEYIMAHVPVISCSFPEVAKVVNEEKIGIAVDSHNVDEIAQAVNRLTRDETLRNTLSNNCRIAKFKYNWEVEKEKLYLTYKQTEKGHATHFKKRFNHFNEDECHV